MNPCAMPQEDGIQRSFSVQCSYLEIYNETVSDLLTGAAGLAIRENPRSGAFVEGLTIETVANGVQPDSLLPCRLSQRAPRS